jgi:hypothetical protein
MIALLSSPLPEGGPLADRPSSSDPSPSSGKDADSRPPSLGAQFGRTRTALLGLVSAHFKLLSAELSEIIDRAKVALALVGIALVLVFLAGMLVCVGSILWLDEWVFGSIGWGVIHGGLLLIAIAVTLVLFVVPRAAPQIGLAFAVALVAAVALFVVLWLQWSSRAWGWVGDNFFGSLAWPFDGHAVSAADRPIAAGVIVLAAGFGFVGVIAGLAVGSGVLRRLGTAIGLGAAAAILGGLLGALLGVPMSWGIAIAVAFVWFLILYLALAAFFVLSQADFTELKNRFIPNKTIETTKETIEWVRQQMPLGRKS